MFASAAAKIIAFVRQHSLALTISAIAVLFCFYTYGLSDNPPGFYHDESAFAYNAYLLAKTGHDEFGIRWPLFPQNFTWPFTVYCNPVCIYLLAAFNLFLPPSIGLARLLSSVAGFETALLLGFLAFAISRRIGIGSIIGFIALVTPWLFEVDRLFFDSSFYPLALALFLFSLYKAHVRERWSWLNVFTLALTLALLTYTYTIGRMLGGLLAFALVSFVTDRQRLFDVAKVWIGYVLMLIPLLVFNLRHPGALSSRFWTLSYMGSDQSVSTIAFRFLSRYLQDLSFIRLLTVGDINPRHHVPGATGSFLAAPFLLALIGILMIMRGRFGNPWWRFIVLGLLAAVVPGALTVDPFHTGRMIACPVFLIVLAIPALEWLFENRRQSHADLETVRGATVKQIALRRTALGILLAATVLQATYFQVVFWRWGPKRLFVLEATYKQIYDAAVSMPSRPIYLADGKFGPGYINALWYATLEGRDTAEFIHLDYGAKAPAGSLVISSEGSCDNCEIVISSGQYSLYKQF